MRYREAAHKLHALGCEELVRQGAGSHRKRLNPVSGRVVSVPDWGPKDLKIGTLRAIVAQLELDWDAFRRA